MCGPGRSSGLIGNSHPRHTDPAAAAATPANRHEVIEHNTRVVIDEFNKLHKDGFIDDDEFQRLKMEAVREMMRQMMSRPTTTPNPNQATHPGPQESKESNEIDDDDDIPLTKVFRAHLHRKRKHRDSETKAGKKKQKVGARGFQILD